jgi:N-methylhydantoinase B
MVRDSMDFATALCDTQGRVVAQGTGASGLMGSIPTASRVISEQFAGDIAAGDVFVVNDPDLGGTHLPDIFMLKPAFLGRTLLGFVAIVAHHQDIGGRVPGGNAVDSTEIFQEGLQIPPLKLYQGGRVNQTLLELWLRNVRVPDIVAGDIASQAAACHVGEQGLIALANRYSPAELSRLMAEILDYSEGRLREEVRAMPDGVYTFEDFMDDDGFSSDPIRISVQITIAGDTAGVSFDGTSAQVRAALNGNMSKTRSSVYIAFKCVTSADIPANDGFYRPIAVSAPEGSILNPVRPAPRAARGLTAYRTVDALFGALAKIVPDRVMAGGDGGASIVNIGGIDADGRQFICVDTYCGGWGARPDRDGVDGTSHLGTNTANVPVEEIELRHPIRVDRYAFIPDTAGVGEYRGCLSISRDLRLLAPEATLQVRSDRRKFQPYGLAGGGSGAPSLNILNPDEGEMLLPTKLTMGIKHGTVLRHVTAGGGGYGDPLKRDPTSVLKDVVNGIVSAAQAQDSYGVIIDPSGGSLDLEATGALRDSRRRVAYLTP